MPRHTRDLRLFAGELQTRIEINEWFPGFLVVEDKLVLPSQSPKLQNPAHVPVDGDDTDLLGLWREHVDQAFVQVHMLPAEGENLSDPASCIQGIKNDVLNCGCGIAQQPGFLVWFQDSKARIDLPKELHFSKRVRA